MISIRTDSTVPITEQIVAGIRVSIARGELRPGDELPPVRQLAADLQINLNTVARAYRALESLGLLSTVRRRGTHVTSASERTFGTRAERRSRVLATLAGVLADAKLAGLNLDTTRELIENQLGRFWPGGKEA